MTQKTIIFDFDGTIADTFSILLNIYNEAAAKFNCRPVDAKDIEKLRSQKPQKFLKEYGVKGYKVPLMAIYIKRQLSKHLLEIDPVDDIDKVLAKLIGQDYKLGILSSNSKSNIETFLRQHGLNGYFDFIYTSRNVFRKDLALKKIIKAQHISKSDVIYVGDETRDIEACKKAGVKIIAVAWGFNSKEALYKLRPDTLIDNPKELLVM